VAIIVALMQSGHSFTHSLIHPLTRTYTCTHTHTHTHTHTPTQQRTAVHPSPPNQQPLLFYVPHAKRAHQPSSFGLALCTLVTLGDDLGTDVHLCISIIVGALFTPLLLCGGSEAFVIGLRATLAVIAQQSTHHLLGPLIEITVDERQQFGVCFRSAKSTGLELVRVYHRLEIDQKTALQPGDQEAEYTQLVVDNATVLR
jgi:hypothetical protein